MCISVTSSPPSSPSSPTREENKTHQNRQSISPVTTPTDVSLQNDHSFNSNNSDLAAEPAYQNTMAIADENNTRKSQLIEQNNLNANANNVKQSNGTVENVNGNVESTEVSQGAAAPTPSEAATPAVKTTTTAAGKNNNYRTIDQFYDVSAG